MRISFFIIALLFASFSLQAQLKIFSEDVPFVKAVKPAMLHMEMKYYLVDTDGKEFGRNGEDFFGKGTVVCALANNRVWYATSAIDPAARDTNLKAYQKAYRVVYREVQFFNFEEELVASIPYDSLSTHSKGGISSIPDALISDSLPMHQMADTAFLGRFEGNLALAFYDVLNGNNEQLKLTQLVKEITFSEGKGIDFNLLIKPGEIVGGVWFEEKIETGSIYYIFRGILELEKDGNLKLLPAYCECEEEEIEEEEDEKEDVGAKNRKKKRKKP